MHTCIRFEHGWLRRYRCLGDLNATVALRHHTICLQRLLTRITIFYGQNLEVTESVTQRVICGRGSFKKLGVVSGETLLLSDGSWRALHLTWLDGLLAVIAPAVTQ